MAHADGAFRQFNLMPTRWIHRFRMPPLLPRCEDAAPTSCLAHNKTPRRAEPDRDNWIESPAR
jgi:hypothetical protein